MTSFLSSNITLLVFRIILAIVFIFAGMEKAANPADFSEAVANYRVISLFLQNIVAIVIPWVEVVSGILLLYGKFLKENSTIISVLLIAFNILVLQAMLRGLDIDCGCFGTIDAQIVGFRKLLENFALLAMGISIFRFSKSETND
ncbi:MAG: hypothetical protein SCALA702_28520 [Melioribacteraceae bacterium]|nr:MAG: hypothetical protein SCALA702_28520 [Melioribacteraceae bacterium]